MSEDPRYPIGKFDGAVEQTLSEREASIASIATLPQTLRTALTGLTDTQLDTPYRDGGWTVRQLIHHVADSHTNAYIRTRETLTRDWPPVAAYDENLWAKLADAHTLPLEPSLSMLEGLHQRWAALFGSLSDEQWQRGYVHSEGGPCNLIKVLQMYEWHGKHHTAHVTELRKRMGW